MAFTYIRRAAVALAFLATAGCTVKSTEPPPLSGPSGLALTLRLNAIPDSISQDGGSQSSVKVTAIGPDGKPVSALPLRMDMFANGVAADFGTLSARSIVTNADGVATVVYTAPPSPPNGVFGTCNSLPGTCISIVATATATNFSTANPESVLIRLVPLGVILPPAGSPTAAFTFSPTVVSANIPVQFDASTSQPGAGASQISSYSWNFGDGTSGSGRTVSHTFGAGNNFIVTLTVTNDRGLTSTLVSQTLSVSSAALPTPVFTVSPSGPGVNEQVFFNASSSTPGVGHTSISSYRWTFGDGATGSGAITSHTYTASGIYIVQLTVTDDAGSAATSPGTQVTVGSPVAPTATFTFSPLAPAVGESVIFDYRLSTTVQGQAIVSLDWNFGDGTAPVHCPGNAACAADGITTHKFQKAGTFTVALVITDAAGRTGTKSTPVTVSAGAATLPTATFTFSPASPGVNETVFFNASTSAPGAGHSIASYAWTFGDGATASTVTATHPYTTAGTYTVQLKVTDEAGQSATSAATQITIGNPPASVAEFTFSPTQPVVGQQVVFDASASATAQGQTIVDVAWNFGDGTAVIHCGTLFPNDASCITTNSGSNRISAHTFAAAQIFTVNLVVTDSAGRTGSKNHTVQIFSPNPTAVLTLAKTGGNAIQADGSASTATGTSTIATFRFTWGDGTADTVGAASSAPHAFAVAGAKTVTLTVTDSSGRTNSTSKDITVP